MRPLAFSKKATNSFITGPRMAECKKGHSLTVNGQATTVFAFTSAFLCDMPQQWANSGMWTQRADKGCKRCFAGHQDRGNLQYDTIAYGRYHHQTMAMRRHQKQLSIRARRQEYSRETGLNASSGTPLQKLSPALDMILTRPADPAHSEFNGITNLSHRH